MIRRTLSLCRRLILMCLHLIAAMLLVSIILLGLMMWKFSQGPIDMTFAADYVRDSLMDADDPVEIAFDSVVAEWPDLRGTPNILLSNFTILEAGEEKLHIGQVSLQIAILPLMIGRIEPETVILNNPVIRMIRLQDGGFQLLLSDEDTDARPEKPLPGLKDIGEGLFLGGKMPDRNLRLFSSLRAFNIKNAKLIAEDHISGVTWIVPRISTYLIRTDDTIDISLNYMMPASDQISVLNARVARLKLRDRLEYSADLRNVDLALLARNFSEFEAFSGQSMVLNGAVQGTLDQETWKVLTMKAALRSAAGSLRLNTENERSFFYKDLTINAIYDRLKNQFSLVNTSMKVNDTLLSISADRVKSEDGKNILPVTVSLPELTLEQISALWPDDYRDSNAAHWLTQKLSMATLKDIKIVANIPEDNPGSFSGHDVEASFSFENLKADYRAPLIPGTEARGTATIKNDILDINVTSGKVADLDVKAANINITELASDHPGEAVITLDMTGPLSTVFEYIALDPINLGETVGIDPKKVGGSGDYKVVVTFPTSKDLLAEQVKVKVDATMRDTRLPGIVRGMDLTGGPLALTVEGGAFTISGKGQLDGAPIDLIYSEYIDPSTAPYASDIQARLVTTKKLRDTFGINLDEFVEGDLPAEIHYKEVKPGDVTVDVKLDMTPARAFIEPFNYVKPAGSPGTATCVAILKNDKIQQIKDLNVVMGPDKASNGQLQFGQVGKTWDVKTGSFSTLSLGKDNQFSLKFTRPAEKTLNFTVTGARIDGRAFLKPDDGKPRDPDAAAVTVTADARTMRMGDQADQIINDPKVSASIDAEGLIRNLDVVATVGKGPFRLVMKPDKSGRMTLTMTAADAGATLHAFDIYDRMVGGTLVVDGMQMPDGRINDLKGAATIRDFRVVNAPVLAKLINSLSLSGFGELLQNQGIAFTRLKTDYTWKETKHGRVISLSDGRTSGASIGLSFGGTVNQRQGTLDISGTFVPMSQINKFVSNIPLIGPLLTGGKNGGIIAATYALKGKSEDPSIFVNPLSVLTPGFLRSILFEGGLDMDDDPEPVPQKAPAKRSGYN